MPGIQFFQLNAELEPWVSVFTGGATNSHFPPSLFSSQKHIPREGIWNRVESHHHLHQVNQCETRSEANRQVFPPRRGCIAVSTPSTAVVSGNGPQASEKCLPMLLFATGVLLASSGWRPGGLPTPHNVQAVPTTDVSVLRLRTLCTDSIVAYSLEFSITRRYRC